MMTVLTENSRYEVDIQGSRIRRTHGANPPTRNQGPDGEWQTYYDVDFGDTMLINWGAGKYTCTSPIVAIREYTP